MYACVCVCMYMYVFVCMYVRAWAYMCVCVNVVVVSRESYICCRCYQSHTHTYTRPRQNVPMTTAPGASPKNHPCVLWVFLGNSSLFATVVFPLTRYFVQYNIYKYISTYNAYAISIRATCIRIVIQPTNAPVAFVECELNEERSTRRVIYVYILHSIVSWRLELREMPF